MPRRETSGAVLDRPPPVPLILKTGEARDTTPFDADLAVRDAARAVEDRQRLADERLSRNAAGHPLTADDEIVIRSIYSAGERSEALRRLGRLRKLQATAGSAADRAASEARRNETASRLAEHGPRLRDEIDRLQAEVSKLEAAAAGAAADLERRAAAVETIQTDPTLLSPARRVTFEFLRRRWEETYSGPARCARLRSDALQAIAKLNPDDRDELQKIHDHCTGSSDSATRAITAVRTESQSSPFVQVSRPGNALLRVTIDRAAWQRHVQELQVEAEQVIAEAERLERKGAEPRKELDEMLASLIPE